MKKKAGQRPTFHKMKIKAGSKFLSPIKVKRLVGEGYRVRKYYQRVQIVS